MHHSDIAVRQQVLYLPTNEIMTVCAIKAHCVMLVDAEGFCIVSECDGSGLHLDLA